MPDPTLDRAKLKITDIDRDWHKGKSDEEIFLTDYWLCDNDERDESTLHDLAFVLLKERDSYRRLWEAKHDV